MSERMKSRVHLEGGLTVDVMDEVNSVLAQWLKSQSATDGLIILRGVACMPVLIPTARIVWVSTLPGGSDDG